MKSFHEENGEVEDGLLFCGCGQFFPVVNYIPRILTGDLRPMLYNQFPDFFLKYKDTLTK